MYVPYTRNEVSVLKGPGKMSGRVELMSEHCFYTQTRHPVLVLVECELDSEAVSTLEGTDAIFVNNLNESSSSSLPAPDWVSLVRDV